MKPKNKLSKTLSSWRPSLTALLSAALIVLSAAPFHLYGLISIALLPTLLVMDRAPSLKAKLREAFWLGFFVSIGAFYWVAYVLNSFGGIPWPLAGVLLVLFACFAEPQFVLFALARFYIKKRLKPAVFPAIAAFAYVAIDTIVPKLFTDTLGHVFQTQSALVQVADLGGPTLLTFLILFWAESLVASMKRVRASLVAAVLLLVLATVYGENRRKEVTAIIEHQAKRVQVAGIQANIGDFEKLAAEQGVRGAADTVLANFQDLSTESLKLSPPPDLVIWPETTYPSTFGKPETQSEHARDMRLVDYIQSKQKPFIFGGYDRDDRHDYNAVFIVDSGSAPGDPLRTQVYRKHVLLWFGEYMPGSEIFPQLRKWFPQVANFGNGPGSEVFSVRLKNARVPELKISPVICYEALFPKLSIDAANRGSQAIVNVTNDSWFGPYGEPDLHFSLTVFRSIETRLPQIRVTNSGISAIVHPDGRIEGQTSVFEKAIINASIPVLDAPIPTLVKKWGNWFPVFSGVVVGLSLLLANLRRRKSPKK